MYTSTKMVKPNEVAMVSTLAASRSFAAGFAASNTKQVLEHVSVRLDMLVLPYDDCRGKLQRDKQLKIYRMLQSISL